MAREQGQLVGIEETLQQQDRLADAGLAQLQGFFDAGHGKTIDLRLQRIRTGHRAVAIGIGLDHRQGTATAEATRQPVVVAQGLQVDQGTGRTHLTLILRRSRPGDRHSGRYPGLRC